MLLSVRYFEDHIKENSMLSVVRTLSTEGLICLTVESDEVILSADNAKDDDDDDIDDESAIDATSMSSPVRSTGPKRRMNCQSSVAVKRPCHSKLLHMNEFIAPSSA
jgi:hypothetical protein